MTEETFTVKLANHGRTIPRETFQQMFPECIWNSALEMSTDTVIEVTHPSVTRKIVSQIRVMCYQKRYGFVNSEITPDEYRAAHHYLNIPIFACMTFPDYNQYWGPYQEEMIRKITFVEYPDYMTFALNVQTLAVMEYIWARIPASETVNVDQHALIVATKKGYLPLIEGLFRRGLSPLSEHKCAECKFNALLSADRAKQLDVIGIMVSRLRPETIIEFLPISSIESAPYLLRHPEMKTEHLFQAVKLLSPEQLHLLARDLIVHPKISRDVLEQFNFLEDVSLWTIETFLKSELSRTEDLPILLIRCLQITYEMGVEVLLQDSRMTRALVLALYPLIKVFCRNDTTRIKYCFERWLKAHPPSSSKMSRSVQMIH